MSLSKVGRNMGNSFRSSDAATLPAFLQTFPRYLRVELPLASLLGGNLSVV